MVLFSVLFFPLPPSLPENFPADTLGAIALRSESEVKNGRSNAKDGAVEAQMQDNSEGG